MSRDKEASYYDVGGIEVLDVIKAKLTPEQYEGYLLGSEIKYSLRVMHKSNDLQGRVRDAQKARNYALWFCEHLEAALSVKLKTTIDTTGYHE